LLLAMSVPASAAVDAKLLDMLKANGSITNTQYSELQAELAKDQKEQQIARQAQQETNEQIAATAKKTNELSTFDQKLAWAAKTQFKGDVRFRQETVQNDGESNNKDQNRQRIRARLGAYSEINPQVDTGIRVATGSNDDAFHQPGPEQLLRQEADLAGSGLRRLPPGCDQEPAPSAARCHSNG
jgi:hypothetical protein